jgi:hypothetical protein
MRAGGANGRVGLQRQKGARRYSLVLTDGKRQGVASEENEEDEVWQNAR